MPSMDSNGHMDYLRFGTQSHRFSDPPSGHRAGLETGLNTKASDRVLDRMQYLCHTCGKHFWSRSRADSHAVLTEHYVLHEDIPSLSSPVMVPSSPAASSISAPRMDTTFTHATDAETSPYADILDQGDSKDIGDEEYSMCSGCGRVFWSWEAANNHARIGHMQDTEMVSLSIPDGSPTFAANASPPTVRGTAPNSPSWTIERFNSPAFSPTSPIPSKDQLSTFTYGNTSPTSDHDTALFMEQLAHLLVPDAFRTENDDNLRQSSHVSPSPSGLVSHSTQDLPHSMNAGPPNTTAPPSPSSSCATLDHPQVMFPCELFDRVFFIVTPSGNPKGPSSIMGLFEAQDPVTFRTGVRDRLGSRGERVGLRKIVARVPWLPVPVYMDTDEDHYQMLMMVKSWPEWQKTDGNTSCHIIVTLEDTNEDREEE